MKTVKYLFYVALFVLSVLGCKKKTIAPVPPTSLVATPISTTQINLTWTDNSTNEAGFKIERKAGTGSYAIVATVGTDVASFSDIGLISNITYTYRVYSYNQAGISLSYSNEASATTFDPIAISLKNGLIVHYPFNNNANDVVGTGNNLISYGSPTFESGLNKKVVNFPNGNDYFLTPSSTWSVINNLPKGTVSFWIKLNSQYISGHYFGIGNSFMTKVKHGVGEDLFFGIQDGTTKLRMQITGVLPSGAESNVYGSTALLVNTWYHVTGVWNGATHILYLNGKVEGQINNLSGIANRSNPDYFSIGSILFSGTTANPSGAYGSMSDLRFYNRALTQSEINYLATY